MKRFRAFSRPPIIAGNFRQHCCSCGVSACYGGFFKCCRGFFTLDACLALLIFSLAASSALHFASSESSYRLSQSGYASRQATLDEIADSLVRQEAACPCASSAPCKIQHCMERERLLQYSQEKYSSNPGQFGFSSLSIRSDFAPEARQGQQCARRFALAGAEKVGIWVCGVPL